MKRSAPEDSSSSPAKRRRVEDGVEESKATSAAAVASLGGLVKEEDSGFLYVPGFGSHVATEALPGALPVGQNNPQKCPYGLYAEQLSGTAFTVARAENQRSWLYRIRPSVQHAPYKPVELPALKSDFASEGKITPDQLRWMPQDYPSEATSWVAGLTTMGGTGEPTGKAGMAIHLYAATADMGDSAMCNADGDFLIVPQEGRLAVRTEMGRLAVEPSEIIVIPRGVRFSIDLPDGRGRGYVLEVYNAHFKLPDLGPLGSNGLANPRDFLYPTAWYEQRECEFRVFTKFAGKMFTSDMAFSPFNVVAWHGNYSPYKYDLRKFCCMNSVSFDHPDPSIYTVLTCPSSDAGVAVADFVIFPPRWMVMEHSFRPPYYHRNCMTEFMGMVWGKYDAKTGFVPGGSSLHSCMTPHGPDVGTFDAASAEELKPAYFDKGLAFMFESTYVMKLTDYALTCPQRDVDYQDCWAALPDKFDPETRFPDGHGAAPTPHAAAAARGMAASRAALAAAAAAAAE